MLPRKRRGNSEKPAKAWAILWKKRCSVMSGSLFGAKTITVRPRPAGKCPPSRSFPGLPLPVIMEGNTDIIFLSPRRFCRASFFVSRDFPPSSTFRPAILPIRPASRRRDHRHFAICFVPSFTSSAPREKSILDFRLPPRRDPPTQMRGGRTRPSRKTALQVPRFKPESVLQ